MKRIVSFIIPFIVVSGLMAQPNTLSKDEMKAGWKLLFDGKSLNGWRNFRSDKPGEAWKVKDGVLYLDDATKKEKKGSGGNLVTTEVYENFELSLEWNIAPCGNSGIIFNVVEEANFNEPWQTGPEIQILDTPCHADGKIDKHRSGDLYDMIECKTRNEKLAGEWNTIKIVSNKGHLEIWQNGEKQVETTMFNPAWDALIAGSKFKSYSEFGKSGKGRICLQDHGDKVSFRNIKIRELK